VELGADVDYLFKEDLKKIYCRYLKFKPDILISVSEEGPLPTLLKKIKLIRIPHVHCWTDDYTDINGRDYGISFIAFCEYFTVANADFIITPSIYRKERCELWGKRVFYIPHGVDVDSFSQSPVNLTGQTKVLYVGEQSDRKGVNKLIDACKNQDFELYLLGEVNEKYREKAPSNVHFVGFVAPSLLPGYLKAADILALSPDDDCTLKMFEYIKAGKAILAQRGKPGYFLTHLVNAYLTDDFSKGLNVLINDKKLRQYIENNVRKIRIHSWKEIAQMWLDTLTLAVEEYNDPNWSNRSRKMGGKSLKSFIRSAM
jgi:glycosyltransferase involved in cell wall biosynthesis